MGIYESKERKTTEDPLVATATEREKGGNSSSVKCAEHSVAVGTGVNDVLPRWDAKSNEAETEFKGPRSTKYHVNIFRINSKITSFKIILAPQSLIKSHGPLNAMRP